MSRAEKISEALTHTGTARALLYEAGALENTLPGVGKLEAAIRELVKAAAKAVEALESP